MTFHDSYHDLSACRRCADAGYFIGSTPISTLNAGATFMTVGQAPGRHEAEVTHRPFSGPAGKRLFRWLAQAGFDEAEFRATQAMVAITRCYPGPHPGGRGDRVPTRAEQALCAPWLETELALMNPRVLIPIGGLAIDRFLGNGKTSAARLKDFALVMLNGSTTQPAVQQTASDRVRPLGQSLWEASPRRSFAQFSPSGTVSRTPAQDDALKNFRMTDLIGERFEREGRSIVPLPHPSGASQWFNVPENKVRLERALQILGALRETLLKG